MMSSLFLTIGSVSAQKKEIRTILSSFLIEKCEDCFNTYYDGKSNSLKINDIKEHAYLLEEDLTKRYVVTGYFYHKRWGNKNFESSPFTAIIDVYGKNVQQITFKKDHLYECKQLYGEKKRKEEQRLREERRKEEQRQYQQKMIKQYKQMLNDFCEEQYSRMFSRRTFVRNSIVFESMEQEDDYTVVKIKGKHQYKGRFGDLYQDMPFEATIENTGREYKITFKKRSKADFYHSTDYWETGTGTVRYSTNVKETHLF